MVRARFPKDRAQQDVFFETLRASPKNGAEDDTTLDPKPTPATT
jgi:hypothetical protein